MPPQNSRQIYSLSAEALKELSNIRTLIKKEILAQNGFDNSENSGIGRTVRTGITCSSEYPYPTSGNTFEVWLGKPDFNHLEVGQKTLHFEGYNPSDEWVRICHSIDDTYYPKDTIVHVVRVEEKWYILGSGSTGSQVIGFQVPGTIYGKPTPQCWYVTINASNSAGVGSDPPLPPDGANTTTTLYKGHSYDTYTNGDAYHSYLWIFQTCDDSLNVGQWLEAGPGGGEPTGIDLISQWANDIVAGDPPTNEDWSLETAATTGCDRDGHITLIDTVLQQPGTKNIDYAIEDIIALLDSDDCDPDQFCIDGEDPNNACDRSIEVDVTHRPCGVDKVQLETDDGKVTVYDGLCSFLYGRRLADAAGRKGAAVLVQSTDPYDTTCYWMIIWLDWFEEIQVVTDVIIGQNGITIERAKILVWDHCKLDNEYIEGETCEEY